MTDIHQGAVGDARKRLSEAAAPATATNGPRLDPDAIAAIRGRVEAATEGPWEAACEFSALGDEYPIWMPDRGCDGAVVELAADAEFIAHARTDVPLLLAALDEARAEVERLRRAGRTLGGIIEGHCTMILDITGLNDWIDEDGDGDWGAVWENAYELRPQRDAALAREKALRDDVAALADEWQAIYDRWLGVSDGPRVEIHRAHAHRLRAVLAKHAPTDEGTDR